MRLILRVRRGVLKRRFSEAALGYLLGQKMLTEGASSRVDRVVKALVALRDFDFKHDKGLTLEKAEKYNKAVEGLTEYKTGSEKGFKVYEANGTEAILKELIGAK